MSIIGTLTVGRRMIDLYAFTSQVVDQQRSTYVQDAPQGTSGTVTVTRLHKILLQNEAGEQKSLEVSDKGFSAVAGNRASFVWGIPKGKTRGDYLAVVNHDTGAVQTIRKPINDLAGPPAYNMLLIAAVIVGCIGLYDFFNGDVVSALPYFAIGAGVVYWIIRCQKALQRQVVAAVRSMKP